MRKYLAVAAFAVFATGIAAAPSIASASPAPASSAARYQHTVNQQFGAGSVTSSLVATSLNTLCSPAVEAKYPSVAAYCNS